MSEQIIVTFDLPRGWDPEHVGAVEVGIKQAVKEGYGIDAETAALSPEQNREALTALMDQIFPFREPRVQRAPNMRGDDPWVDARQDQRSAVEDFIEAIVTGQVEVQP